MLSSGKKFALILAVLTALSTACGETPAPAADETTTAPDTDPAPSAPVLPERNYEDASFIYLNGNTSYAYGAVTAEEETGDAVNDAVFRRNMIVEDRYHVKFEEIMTTSVTSDAMKSIAAGDDAFDIALMHVEDALSVTLQGGAVDYADIPYLNPTERWWLTPTIETMSLGGHSYYGVSMFDLSHFESTRALFFNKRMVEDNGLPSLYDLVREGKWTIDKMKEYGKTAIRDLNGDGEWTWDDCYAFSSWGNVGAPALMVGLDAPLTLGKDKNDYPVFDLATERMYDRMDRLCDVLFSDEHFMIVQYTGDQDFVKGHCMFYSNLITSSVPMREMADDFGIITYPKYDEEQENYSNYGGSPFYMVAPATSSDLERTGILTEALAYESLGLTDRAYYDVTLQGKISRDDDSVEMLDLIFSTLSYQIPIAQKYVQNNLVDGCIWNNQRGFASYFAANQSVIQSDIDEAVAAFRKGVGE